MKRVSLICHPSTRHGPLRDVFVDVARSSGGGIALGFRLIGDIRRLRVPAPLTPRPRDGLWRHTCVEAFVMAGAGPGYREFNLSPSGEWAGYAFRGYREPAAEVITLDPGILVHARDDRLDLQAVIAADALPPTSTVTPLRLGLSVVAEDADGALSYWALRHPPGAPDFHHPDAFALDVDSLSS
jgi:hypothetical protein